jgi:D-3-phosphoglycerate dehydrogenase
LLGLARQAGYVLGAPIEPTGLPVRLRGKVLGLVGFGGIAQQVAPRAQALGLSVIAYDRHHRTGDQQDGVAFVEELDELLVRSDAISLHVPSNPQTRQLLGAAQLARMKPSALLINTARGDLIDTAALTEALERGRLGGAGLDVTDPEPLPADHPLRARPNVLITPHTAFSSDSAIEDLARSAAHNVLDILDGRLPEHVVNSIVLQSPRLRVT